jgi:ABC-type hemin transport system substrate-binding protein
MSVPVKVAMIEVDLDENDNQVLDRYHTLIHEDETTGTGIVILSLGAINTEAILAANTDAVITVRTKGTTPASLDTVTSTDNAAVGVWQAGASLTTNWDNRSAADDRTVYHVPAGYGVEVALTTAGSETSVAGDGAGKMLVMVEYVVVPRTVTENL